MRYDVAIIGAGEAGVFAGYELMRKKPELSVLILEQGADIYSRRCPIVAGKVKSCIGCKPCAIMAGFGGAGAFSDGKYNFTTEFGGWLTDYMDGKELMDLIDYVDSINVEHGATTDIFSTDTPEAKAIEIQALHHDLHLLGARCKHLGTENNLKILQSIYEHMKDHVEFRLYRGNGIVILDLSIRQERFDAERLFVALPEAVLAEQEPAEGIIDRGLAAGVVAVDTTAPSIKIQLQMCMALEIFQHQALDLDYTHTGQPSLSWRSCFTMVSEATSFHFTPHSLAAAWRASNSELAVTLVHSEPQATMYLYFFIDKLLSRGL